MVFGVGIVVVEQVGLTREALLVIQFLPPLVQKDLRCRRIDVELAVGDEAGGRVACS